MAVKVQGFPLAAAIRRNPSRPTFTALHCSHRGCGHVSVRLGLGVYRWPYNLAGGFATRREALNSVPHDQGANSQICHERELRVKQTCDVHRLALAASVVLIHRWRPKVESQPRPPSDNLPRSGSLFGRGHRCQLLQSPTAAVGGVQYSWYLLAATFDRAGSRR